MKGLSQDIQNAINTILEGLEYKFQIHNIESSKMKAVMESKSSSFRFAKQMMNKWSDSPNSPSDAKLMSYVERLVVAGDSALESLREGLSAKIDFDDIDDSKFKTAIQAKTFIYGAIEDINSDLIELRLQLESGELNLDDSEFHIGYAEKYAKGEFYNIKNYHKKRYDEKRDCIIISPDSSIGKVVDIYGFKIALPKPPRDKKDILFSDLPKREQFWRRSEPPKGLNKDNKEAYADFILEEFRRRREGVWFMNYGKKVWLTGSAYFGLQWFEMKDDGDYMKFRYAQLNMFYFAEACDLDERCIGQLFVKSRRTGFTYVTLAKMLNEATSVCNRNFGITSMTEDDAEKAFNKLSYGFLNLPFFFRPVVKGLEDSSKLLEFAKPSDKSKKAKKEGNTSTSDYLNVLFDYEATKDGAYDGQKMRMYLGDEAGKWKKPNDYVAHWNRIRPTFDQGGHIVGTAYIGSTVNPMKEGGSEFKKLYYSSLLEKRSEITLRTPSGLYAYFLPAQDNMEKFTDIYGVCHLKKPRGRVYNVHGELITMGSVTFLEAKRKAAKKEGEIEYNELLRAEPMCIEDAFRDDASKAIFNLTKIYDQIATNDSIENNRTLVRGNFGWKDGVVDSTVEWYPNDNGKFLTSWIPSNEIRNSFYSKRGVKYPNNEHIGCFGCDPYDISGVVGGGGSKGSLHGLTKFNMENAPSNEFFLEYVNRPQTAEIFFEDVLMACVFYGMPILIENNKPRILYHFKNRGYRGFSMNRPDRKYINLSKTEKELGGVPNSSEDMKQTHSSAIESYIEKYVGVANELSPREDGEMGRMLFNNTLSDWAGFDISKRTNFDASISSGLSIMANQKNMYIKKVDVSTKIIFNISTFNNKGNLSKLIS